MKDRARAKSCIKSVNRYSSRTLCTCANWAGSPSALVGLIFNRRVCRKLGGNLVFFVNFLRKWIVKVDEGVLLTIGVIDVLTILGEGLPKVSNLILIALR
jgi:hypothetical protein